MKIFNGFNGSGDDKCPVCNTADNKDTVLIPIASSQDGNVYEAFQVHLDCMHLIGDIRKDQILIFQFIDKDE